MRIREYDDIPAISNTWLGHFKRSPKHYQYLRLHPEPPTEALTFGIAFHTYVLERHKFEQDVCIFDPLQRPVPDSNFNKTENRKWKAEFLDEHSGKEIITPDQFEHIKRMDEALREHELAGELLQMMQSTYEDKIVWEYNGQRCKGLIDQRHPQFLHDLKTCMSADPDEWTRFGFFKYDLYRQCGMYSDGDADGKLTYVNKLKDFFFSAVEKEPPYAVAVYQPSKEVIWKGIEEYRTLVEQFQSCIKSGVWQGYEFKSIGNALFPITLPHYMRE